MISTSSWCNSFRISGEQRSVSDVLQSTIQHHHSFKSNSSSSVRVGSISETFDVVLDSCRVDSLENSSFLEQLWFMNPLSSRKDLFSSHEEVKRAGIVGIVVAGHGIEWSGGLRVTMEHVEISIIFLFNYIM